MAVIQPRVRVLRRRCAPRTYPCPRCGRRGRRKDTHTRRVRDLAYQEILILELTVGEYRARCGCCKTFRSRIGGIEARAEYTNRVREAVIDRLLAPEGPGEAQGREQPQDGRVQKEQHRVAGHPFQAANKPPFFDTSR